MVGVRVCSCSFSSLAKRQQQQWTSGGRYCCKSGASNSMSNKERKVEKSRMGELNLKYGVGVLDITGRS